MTFSIVACDLNEKAWGVAVASKFPAAGAVVPWAQADSGTVATQSFANTSFGLHGLEVMVNGLSAEEALLKLIVDDADRELRQVGLMDTQVRAATFTGGDKRGRQSAAIYVVKPKGGYGGFGDRWRDYRVAGHADPVPRSEELIELHRLHFEKSPESERVPLKGKSLEQMTGILRREGYLKKNKSFAAAFHEFIGNENFEERAEPTGKWIDKPAMKYLLKKFGK